MMSRFLLGGFGFSLDGRLGGGGKNSECLFMLLSSELERWLHILGARNRNTKGLGDGESNEIKHAFARLNLARTTCMGRARSRALYIKIC